jgi:arginase family enzyme
MRVVPVLFPCDLASTERGEYRPKGERGAPDLILDMFEGEGVRFAKPLTVQVPQPESGDPEDAPLKLDAAATAAVRALAEGVARVNADGDFPLILGGDQLAALGQIVAAGERARGIGLAVLCDAHLDLALPAPPAHGEAAKLKDPGFTYDGDLDRMVLSAALRRLPAETELGALMAKTSLNPKQTSVVGVRSPNCAQVRQQLRKLSDLEVWDMERLELDGESAYRSMLTRHLEMGPIALSIDASGLDPALMTAVRRTAPDGVDWAFLKRSLEQCAPHVDRLLGIDISQVDGSLDDVHHSSIQRLVEALAPFVQRVLRHGR